MKTIWIINHYAIPPSLGGVNRHYYFTKFLVKKGYKVKIFTSSQVHNTPKNFIDDDSLFKELNIEGVDYTFIKTRKYDSGYLSRILNMIDFPVNMFKVSKKFEKPDVIYSSSPNPLSCVIGNILSKKFKCKSLVEVRDLWPESILAYGVINKKNPLLKLMYFGEKWIYRTADKVIFTMQGGKDYIIDKKWNLEQGGPINTDKIFHINNGVDINEFDYNKGKFTMADLDLENLKTFKVVYTGSIRKANNLKLIVDAAEYVQEYSNLSIKFLIYGDGTDRKTLEEYCDSKGIKNIVFKGNVEKKYIPGILSKANITLLNYSNEYIWKYGGSQNKIFDYLAAGRPILSTIKMGYDIITTCNAGVSIENQTPKNIGDAIIKIYNMDENSYNEICLNARKTSLDYDFIKLTDKLVDLL